MTDQKEYDTWCTSKMICPWCGREVDDTDYHGDSNGTATCDNDECGKEFDLEIEYSASYYTKKPEGSK